MKTEVTSIPVVRTVSVPGKSFGFAKMLFGRDAFIPPNLMGGSAERNKHAILEETERGMRVVSFSEEPVEVLVPDFERDPAEIESKVRDWARKWIRVLDMRRHIMCDYAPGRDLRMEISALVEASYERGDFDVWNRWAIERLPRIARQSALLELNDLPLDEIISKVDNGWRKNCCHVHNGLPGIFDMPSARGSDFSESLEEIGVSLPLHQKIASEIREAQLESRFELYLDWVDKRSQFASDVKTLTETLCQKSPSNFCFRNWSAIHFIEFTSRTVAGVRMTGQKRWKIGHDMIPVITVQWEYPHEESYHPMDDKVGWGTGDCD